MKASLSRIDCASSTIYKKDFKKNGMLGFGGTPPSLPYERIDRVETGDGVGLGVYDPFLDYHFFTLNYDSIVQMLF
jgi:hypothetical protein